MDPVSDYERLLELINTSEGRAFKEGEVYQELLNTEKRALKNASRISTQRSDQDNLAELLSNIKVGQVFRQFTHTWYLIYKAAMDKTLSLDTFLMEDRKIYVGIMLLLIAVFLLLLRL